MSSKNSEEPKINSKKVKKKLIILMIEGRRKLELPTNSNYLPHYKSFCWYVPLSFDTRLFYVLHLVQQSTVQSRMWMAENSKLNICVDKSNL